MFTERVLLGLTLWFVLIDLPLIAQAITRYNRSCGPASVQQCAWKSTTYLKGLDRCVYFHPTIKESFDRNIRQCNFVDSSLLRPITKEGAKALNKFAQGKGINHSWLGLRYDEEQDKFIWSSNGIVHDPKKIYTPAIRGGKKGKCVAAHFGKSLEWMVKNCLTGYLISCGQRPVRLPGTPQISVVQNLTAKKFKAGSTLSVKCGAMLSTAGNLRFVVFSGSSRTFFGFSHPRVDYEENLTLYTFRMCKRQGFASLKLITKSDMDGKKLACITYIKKGIPMCSQYDEYCAVAGTLNVLQASQWWALILFGLMIPGCLLALVKCFEPNEHAASFSEESEGHTVGEWQSSASSATGASNEKTE